MATNSPVPGAPVNAQPVVDSAGKATTPWYAWFQELKAFLPTFPLSVPNGGTGKASLTAHSVLLGEGTGSVAFVSPGTTSGVPLVNQAGADPVYGIAVVAGGGTGLATLTAHALLVGEGVANVGLVGPGATSGIPLINQAGADPVYGVAIVQGGGTGTNTLPAHAALIGNGTNSLLGVLPGSNGNVLTSNGTDWTSAAIPAAAQQWNAGTVTALGSELSISSTTLHANWRPGTVTVLATGLTLAAGSLTPDWQAGTVTTIGTGLTLSAGTLHT